jgi:hypothetical protein
MDQEKTNVTHIFRMFDTDGSSDLDHDELHAALVAIDLEDIGPQQVCSHRRSAATTTFVSSVLLIAGGESVIKC